MLVIWAVLGSMVLLIGFFGVAAAVKERALESQDEARQRGALLVAADAVADAQKAMRKAALPCPDCGVYTALSPGVGELHEDVCTDCHGRLLKPEGTERLLLEHHGLSHAQLMELKADPFDRMVNCPLCKRYMVPRRVRGAVVQLCGTCGHSWLSHDDFVTLSEGRFEALLPPQS